MRGDPPGRSRNPASRTRSWASTEGQATENAGAGGVPAAAADVRQVNELARAGALVDGLKIGR